MVRRLDRFRAGAMLSGLASGCSSVVERNLAKVDVEGSSPFSRSIYSHVSATRRLETSPVSGATFRALVGIMLP